MMADDHDAETPAYVVGYGKPPQNTRFKKGQSGNPNGRKARVKNVATLLSIELDRLITVRDGAIEKKISKREAIITSLVNDGIKGKPAARQMLISLLNVAPQPDPFVADANDDLALEAFLKSARQQGDGKSVETGDEGDA
jgi:hypothetical protein